MIRRNFLQAGLGLPMASLGLTGGLGGCSDSSNRYLDGNYGPVSVESTAMDLEVTGNIPNDLIGRFLRNGPNPPADIGRGGYHWFTGQGMIHGLKIANGKAEWYKNRYVGSESGISPNTNIIGHAGRTIAIVESGGLPVNMSYDIASKGVNTSLGGGFSAHPKLDPDTGELHVLCYDWANLRDHVRYVVINAEGELDSEMKIPLPGMPMIHDMSLTENFVVIYDLPVTLSFLALGTGSDFPFRWDNDYEARVGLLPRNGLPSDIIWSPLTQNYSYHPMNAFEDASGNVVIDIVRYDKMFDKDTNGPFGDSRPRLERWTVNPRTQKVNEQVVDGRGQEFPRCHPELNSKPHQFGYTVAVSETGSFPSIYKHDMNTGAAWQYDFGSGRSGAEPVFVPREGAKEEDDGYLMTYVYDANKDTSELIILDAMDLSRPALAQIHLPTRVPYGFHGNWIPDSLVSAG